MDTRVFVVRGMHCAACVDKVERALRGVSGVERASVNLATERASVEWDPARADARALAAAVAGAGYELAEAPPSAAPAPANPVPGAAAGDPGQRPPPPARARRATPSGAPG